MRSGFLGPGGGFRGRLGRCFRCGVLYRQRSICREYPVRAFDAMAAAINFATLGAYITLAHKNPCVNGMLRIAALR